MSVFRSAIEGDDHRVDAGYLALFWTMAVTVTMVPIICVFTAWLCYKGPEKAADYLSSLGVVIAALGAQCAAVIGAVGLFRAGDKTHVAQPAAQPPMVAAADNVNITPAASPAKPKRGK